MTLPEQVRLRLEVADRAMAFHSAACHLDNADPEVIRRFEDLTKAIEVLDAFENPPAQVCVQEPAQELDIAAVFRADLKSCTAGTDCPVCYGIRAYLSRIGESP